MVKGFTGHHHSEATKLKLSLARRGCHNSPLTEFKRGQVSGPNNPFYGKHHSEKTRMRWSKIRRGRRCPQISKTRKRLFAEGKLIHPWKGKHLTENIKTKIGKANEGKIPWNKGKNGIYSKVTLEKIREARLNRIFPVKDTDIEILMQDELRRRGVNFERHTPICGICQPDIIFPERRIAVFCDGDYWHGLPEVQAKDRRQEKALRQRGWNVLRFWEHEINSDAQTYVDQIQKALGREGKR